MFELIAGSIPTILQIVSNLVPSGNVVPTRTAMAHAIQTPQVNSAPIALTPAANWQLVLTLLLVAVQLVVIPVSSALTLAAWVLEPLMDRSWALLTCACRAIISRTFFAPMIATREASATSHQARRKKPLLRSVMRLSWLLSGWRGILTSVAR